MRPLRIAMVSTPHLPTPPVGSGGTELVVGDLVAALVARGHEVVLFAHPGSLTTARLVSFPTVYQPPIGERFDWRELAHLALALQHREAVDLVHNHCLAAAPVLAARLGLRALSTLHYLHPLLRTVPDHPVVAISQHQRARAAGLRVLATIHHGLDLRRYTPAARKGRYLLFLGRFSEKKGAEYAIAAARRLGLPLLLAAPPAPGNAYFETVIRPQLGGSIVYLGEVGGAEKSRLLAEALCLLMPVQWDEPFGLTAIEALASGTPVVGLRRGALPEIVEEGVTGYLVETPDDLPGAVRRALDLSPQRCRAAAEARFSVERMVAAYSDLYQRLSAAADTDAVRWAGGR